MTDPARGAVFMTLVLLSASAARADDAVTFRYKMAPADRLIYETTSTVNQTQKFNDQEFKNVIKSREVSVRTLQQVDDDGNLRVQSENKLLKVEMTIGPLGKYVYDSASTERDKSSQLGAAVTPIYESLTGAYTTIIQSPRGEVLKVEGLAELLKGALKDNPLAQQFASGASEEGAKAQFSDFFIQFPEKALKPGDTWEVPGEFKLPNVGSLTAKATYTYVGPDQVGDLKTAKFTQVTDITIDVKVGTGGAKVTGTVTSTDSTGTIQFDPEKGQLVSKTGRMKLTGNLTVNAGDNVITIEQNQTHETSVKLLDKLPQ